MFQSNSCRFKIRILRILQDGFVLYSPGHTCATLLLASGENPKKVADRLGHSSVRTTLDTYSRVLPEMERSTSDKLEEMLYLAVGTHLAHKREKGNRLIALSY